MQSLQFAFDFCHIFCLLLFLVNYPSAAKSDDHLVFSELLLTIAALTVRHELCARVEEIGGVKHIYDGMVSSEHYHFFFLSSATIFVSTYQRSSKPIQTRYGCKRKR